MNDESRTTGKPGSVMGTNTHSKIERGCKAPTFDQKQATMKRCLAKNAKDFGELKTPRRSRSKMSMSQSTVCRLRNTGSFDLPPAHILLHQPLIGVHLRQRRVAVYRAGLGE